MASRRAGVAVTALGMQILGLAAIAIVVAAIGRWPQFSAAQIPWALALAVVGTLSLVALYRAFALGPIAIVSPVVASYAALSVVGIVVFLGVQSGYASFVMTGSGAYPIIPAVLAILVLRERLAPNQYLGVAILIAGLVGLGVQS